jgi:hypothetical protein
VVCFPSKKGPWHNHNLDDNLGDNDDGEGIAKTVLFSMYG